MGAVIVGLRPGDHKELAQIAERLGRPAKEVAAILLEQAIRRERAGALPADGQLTATAPRGPGAAT